MKTLFASVAVASLALSQPAAAATRSADSLPVSGVQTPAAADRVGSTVADSEDFRGRKPILVIVLVFAVLAALVLALSGGNSSPG